MPVLLKNMLKPLSILIAPDSFKEALTASEVAAAIELGFHAEFPDAHFSVIPMADGGEGSLLALNQEWEATLHQVQARDPLGNLKHANFKILSDQKTALIEMATISGLSLIPVSKRKILLQNTFGTGELILQAFSLGARKFIIFLGGSATCDGGIGALAALGCTFKNHHGEKIAPIPENLAQITTIENNIDPELRACEFILVHDVDNTLLGLDGAIMYAPQKGADAATVEILNAGLENYAFVLEQNSQKSISKLPGSGAAGGLGAGLSAFLNTQFKPGGPYMIQALQLEKKIKSSDLILTAEGKMDDQTLHGKTPIAIAKLAKQHAIPVIAFTGQLGDNFAAVYEQGITAVFPIAPGPISLEDSLQNSKQLLTQTANTVARTLKKFILKPQP